MEDTVMDDEKKPFDAENAANDDDTQPDPEEELIMQANNGRVWMVKVCRPLTRFPLHGLKARRYHGILWSNGLLFTRKEFILPLSAYTRKP